MVDISISASPTRLIETEETATTVTLQLSEPPPEGGLTVPINLSIDSGAPKPLAQFNLNNFDFDGATLQTVPDTDTLNRFTLNVTKQTAKINLNVKNDNFDEGTDKLTLSLAESEDFNIASNAGSTTFTILEEPTNNQPEGGKNPPDGGEQGEQSAPTVSFDLTPDSLNEEEGGNLSLDFSVDGEVPEDGLTLNLGGEILDAVLDNQFNLGQAEATGLDILRPGGEGGEGSEGGEGGEASEGGENGNEAFPGLRADFLRYPIAGEFDDVQVQLNQADASISLPVSNDVVAEQDQSYSFSISKPSNEGGEGGEGSSNFTIDSQASEDSFSVTDGVDNVDTPVVSFSANKTEIESGEQVTLNFTVNGQVPNDGITVAVDSESFRTLSNILKFNENNNPVINNLEGIGGFPEGDVDDSGFFVNLTAQQASLTLPLTQAGGEGGESSEGGEGGEGGNTSNADVNFATELVLMKGHLRVANQLIEAGATDQAPTHLNHPQDESYTEEFAQKVQQRGIDPFLEELQAVPQAFNQASNPANSDSFQTAFDNAIAKIDNALNSVSGFQQQSPKFILPLIDSVLSVAAEEYNASIENGQFVNTEEYQDSKGFLEEAEILFNNISNQLSSQARSTIETALNNLSDAWPSATIPDSPVKSPSEVSNLVTSIDEAVTFEGEGSQSFTFNLLDGENYGVDSQANTIDLTINQADGGEQGEQGNNTQPTLTFGSTDDDVVEQLQEGQLNFTGEGEDLISTSDSGSRVYGGNGADELEVLDGGNENRLFAGAGGDFIELSLSGEGNRAYAGDGNDTLSMGSSDRAFGGNGDDIFLMQGGDNLVTGSAGAEQFWALTSTELPDTPNTITDFDAGEGDVIGIGGGITANQVSFDNETLLVDDQAVAILSGATDLSVENNVTFGNAPMA